VIIVNSFPELGRLAAMRFLEVVYEKPNAVCSLPTGKTPEYFIKWVRHILSTWGTEPTIKLCKNDGLDIPTKPDLSRVRFVQMDEFSPIDPEHANSFNYYIRRYYIDGLGLNPANCLLMDTSGEFVCENYEEKIRLLGGIDFFLGGLGPDGHVAFNIRGSSPDSRTRQLHLNYESMAIAAESLGGMTAAQTKNVVTIGLGTITAKSDAVIILFAAGEAKAQIVADVIDAETDCIQFPAHAFRCMQNFCVYSTKGAAKLLKNRVHVFQSVQERVYRKCLESSSPLPPSLTLKSKLEIPAIIRSGKFLHTEPHHDDILLGYLPLILEHRTVPSRDVFVTCTSGFNSVSNQFLLEICQQAEKILKCNQANFGTYADDCRLSPSVGIVHRLLRQVGFDQAKLGRLSNYLLSLFPGQKDSGEFAFVAADIRGACREFEGECVWTSLGWEVESVNHLRLGFYSGEIFASPLDYSRDSAPVFELLMSEKPDVVTVALDPESSGPDTHYKVLQCVTAALDEYVRQTGNSVTVIGYRNVWFKFGLWESDLIIPVTESQMHATRKIFTQSYLSQTTAEFPSYLHNGPFSDIVDATWRQQADDIRVSLGDPDAFPYPGAIFLKLMTVDQLGLYSRSLKESLE
jgi:glucosamine-6-phosphate deaminase